MDGDSMNGPGLWEKISEGKPVPDEYKRLAKPIDKATRKDVLRLTNAGIDPTEEARDELFDTIDPEKIGPKGYLYIGGEKNTFNSIDKLREAFIRGDMGRATYERYLKSFRDLAGTGKPDPDPKPKDGPPDGKTIGIPEDQDGDGKIDERFKGPTVDPGQDKTTKKGDGIDLKTVGIGAAIIGGILLWS